MTQTSARRIIVIQPVVPSYRNSFFNAVAPLLGDGFAVHASDTSMGVLTENAETKPWHMLLGPMLRLGPGAEWQRGALSVPISRGDVVVVSGAPRCLSNILLLLKARLTGARTIWWGQLWSGTSRWHRFVLRLMLMRLAHSILFYTDAEVAAYKARYGRRDMRLIGALNNGIDVKPIQALRLPYDAQTRSHEILFLGRLTEKAQIALLLEAMTSPFLANTILHIIGDGPDKNALQDWVRQNALESRVIWHGGTVNESEIASVANRAAVMCYPGGVGLSLIHAMAYGLPTVVHDERSTHMPEIAAFNNGVTGASFVKGDINELAIALADLLADPVKRAAMSKEALYRADTAYNTESMAARFVRIVEANRETSCE